MSYANVSSGKNLPSDFNVIIEIPMQSAPVKYEVDKETHALFVDRFISTPMFYPANYGYIPETLSEDGDPIDVLVVTPYPVVAGSVVRSRAVGALLMEDESGEDAKVIAVPHSKLTNNYDHVKDVDDLPAFLKSQIQHFFENYKALENGKWVKMKHWVSREEANALIMQAKRG